MRIERDRLLTLSDPHPTVIPAGFGVEIQGLDKSGKYVTVALSPADVLKIDRAFQAAELMNRDRDKREA